MTPPYLRVNSAVAALLLGIALCRPTAAQEPAAEVPALVPTPTVAPAPQAPPNPPSGSFQLAEALRGAGQPLSSDQAAELAKQAAPSLAAARASGDQARAAAREALVAAYPRLDLEARYTRVQQLRNRFRIDFTEGPFAGEVLAGESAQPLADQYNLQAQLSYGVSDLFFQVLPRYRAAERAAEAERHSQRAGELGVRLAAKEAYYSYARARAAKLVVDSALEQTLAQKRDVDAQVAAGAVARVEQMRAEAGVAAARVSVARAAAALARARVALRTLLGQPGEGEYALVEDLEAPLPAAEPPEQLFGQALQRRSELKALEALADARDLQRGAHGADRYPKLSVGAVYDLGNPNLRVAAFEREWRGSWSLMGMLRWSPNDAFAGDARRDQVGADLARLRADLSALRDSLRVEVRGAYEDHEAARSAMEAAQAGIVAAEESYRVRREQFRAGAAVVSDLVDAELELRQARLQLVDAAIDARIARARLDRAIER